MSMLISVVTLLAGLLVLTLGAHWFVNGAVGLAERMRISRLMIGLTVVAFGTSSPELFLDTAAAFRGATDLALGDLVGSNIANMGLILGVAAIARPLALHSRLFRFELPIVLAVSAGFWGLAVDGEISRVDGAILLACFFAFLMLLFWSARYETKAIRRDLEANADVESEAIVEGSSWIGVAYFVVGLVLLIVGAQLMVVSATSIAGAMGVSNLVIGLTIVAMGTSLPELATALAATWREECDLSVGNVLGSNVFNTLFIMGLIAQISPLGVSAESLKVDLPIMLGIVVLFGLLVVRGMRLNRIGGVLLLCAYAAFIGLKFL